MKSNSPACTENQSDSTSAPSLKTSTRGQVRRLRRERVAPDNSAPEPLPTQEQVDEWMKELPW